MLLVRRAVTPNDCQSLLDGAKNAIQGVLAKQRGASKKKLKHLGYYTFPAVGNASCECKYDYD
eukprot:3761146-Lingulodinium_polyedra.AAC.1